MIGADRYLDYLAGRSDGFFTKFFDAIIVADRHQRRRLARGFPDELIAHKTWLEGGVKALAKICTQDNPLIGEMLKIDAQPEHVRMVKLPSDDPDAQRPVR